MFEIVITLSPNLTNILEVFLGPCSISFCSAYTKIYIINCFFSYSSGAQRIGVPTAILNETSALKLETETSGFFILNLIKSVE